LRSDAPAEFTIVLNSPGSVEGVVTRDGEPVIGTHVNVTMESGESAVAVTNDAGQYAIKGLPEGSGTFLVEVPHSPDDTDAPKSVSRSVTVSWAETSTVDVEVTTPTE
jgi:hypothetical protein